MKKLFFLVFLLSSLLIGGSSGCVKNQSALIVNDSDQPATATPNSSGSYNYGNQPGTQTAAPSSQAQPRDYSGKSYSEPRNVEPQLNEDRTLARVIISDGRKLKDVKIEIGYNGYPAYTDIPVDSNGTKTLWLPFGCHMVNSHAYPDNAAAVQNGRAVYPLYVNGVKLTYVERGFYTFRVLGDGSVTACSAENPCYGN